MARLLPLVLALALAAPVAKAEGMAQGITFPVISDWVMWRVRVAQPIGQGAGDVTVRLNDVARVGEVQARAAGADACAALGRSFQPTQGAEAAVLTEPEREPFAKGMLDRFTDRTQQVRTWTWRGACL